MSSNDKFFNEEMEALAQDVKSARKSASHTKRLGKLYLAVQQHFSGVFGVLMARLRENDIKVYDFDPVIILQATDGNPILPTYPEQPIAQVGLTIEEIGKVKISMIKSGLVQVYKFGGGSGWNGMPTIEIATGDDAVEAGDKIFRAIHCLKKCLAIVHNVADEDERKRQILNVRSALSI